MENPESTYFAFLHHETQIHVLVTLTRKLPAGATVKVSIRSEQGIEPFAADRIARTWLTFFDDIYSGERPSVPFGWESVDPMPYLEAFH